MRKRKPKVVVAMSGGVDSSVAAGLLVEQGYRVQGVSLRMWEETRGPRVCSDHRGAKDVARYLGISHELVDLRSQFVETVVKPFAQDYLRGRTPNPCISCNRDFKLGTLLRWAREHDTEFVATGHYARIGHREEVRPYSLLRGVDRHKDQSYFLFALSQEQLAGTMFPLGEMGKGAVREHARRLGLDVADRAESQDICFGDYRALVRSHARQEELGGGEIVDRGGRVLGRHEGIHGLTIGQRRGLGIAAPEPLYVLAIDEHSRRVVVGGKDDLRCHGLIAQGMTWIEPPVKNEIEAEVQIRYRAPAIPCIVRLDSGRQCEVRFASPCPAVTPGQAAVLYRGEVVLGGGWIKEAIQQETSRPLERRSAACADEVAGAGRDV